MNDDYVLYSDHMAAISDSFERLKAGMAEVAAALMVHGEFYLDIEEMQEY